MQTRDCDSALREIYARDLRDSFDIFILDNDFAKSTYRRNIDRTCCYPCEHCGEAYPHVTLSAENAPDMVEIIAALFLLSHAEASRKIHWST